MSLIVIGIICAVAATACAIAFNKITRPAMVRALFENETFLAKVELSEECTALMCLQKFPWYCDPQDFFDYATALRIQDPKIGLIGNYTKKGGYALTCDWWKRGIESTKYNLEKAIGKYCRTAVPTCALIIPGTPMDQIIKLAKDIVK